MDTVAVMPNPRQVANLPNLAAIREGKSITLESIAQTTKISTRYLRAIEDGDFRLLPGGVFATSYIRQYAQAIDYDEWHLLECYRAAVPPEELLPAPPPEEPKRGLVPALLRFLAGA